MRADVTNEAQLRAARQLALHLRQKPEDAKRPPEDLAKQFGLPAAFVSNVLSGVQGPVRKADPWLPRIDFSFILHAYNWIDGLFNRLISNPVLFVLATTTLVVLTGFFTGAASFRIGPESAEGKAGIGGWIVFITALVAFGLHMMTFFKKRMVRYALLSGLGLWIGFSFLTLIMIWLGQKDQPTDMQMTLTGLLLLTAFGILILCSLYAAMGSGAAILGAYIEMLRLKLREDRMSRQDLLEHYFELQERLDSSNGLSPRPGIFDSDFAKAIVNTGPLWALLTGLVLKALLVFLMLASGFRVGRPDDFGWAFFASAALSAITFTAYVLAGFFAKNAWYAIVQSLAITVGGLPAVIIGVQFFGLRSMDAQLSLPSLAITGIAYVVVSIFGALGGIVQRRAAKELNLAQNDPATILAEMVRLQWKLSDRRSSICVMVVDAAKSSEMKSLADPLAVEYSFREYQNLLTELSASLRGRVHSTAGDGAVIAFESATDAFIAGKRIQTDIERFNREDNRLQLPFRLRIGLHLGEIVGELDEVEFTEVIDIAAHVQAAAPVGGIAVTEEVANNLPMEEFIPLAKQIDGQNVLLALNPTVDEPWQTYST